ncbi:MAG: hypothetical protein Q9172_002228 [Xanthocarpia lactea]
MVLLWEYQELVIQWLTSTATITTQSQPTEVYTQAAPKTRTWSAPSTAPPADDHADGEDENPADSLKDDLEDEQLHDGVLEDLIKDRQGIFEALRLIRDHATEDLTDKRHDKVHNLVRLVLKVCTRAFMLLLRVFMCIAPIGENSEQVLSESI